MKRLIIVFLLLLGFSSIVEAKNYHLFFIAQKQTFVVNSVEYSAWALGSNPTRYFALPSDPKPEGYTVHNVMLLASAGIWDMIYIVVQDAALALEGTSYPEYAGGSSTTTASAWLDFTVRSFLQKGKHADFAAGAAAKAALKVRWQYFDAALGENAWKSGTLGDWIAAGSPEPSVVNPGNVIFNGEE